MILTFDIGNTTIVMGGYEGDNIAFRARLSTNIDRTDDEYAVLIKAYLSCTGANLSNRGLYSCIRCPPSVNIMKAY